MKVRMLGTGAAHVTVEDGDALADGLYWKGSARTLYDIPITGLLAVSATATGSMESDSYPLIREAIGPVDELDEFIQRAQALGASDASQ